MILELHRQGVSVSAIGREVGLIRNRGTKPTSSAAYIARRRRCARQPPGDKVGGSDLRERARSRSRPSDRLHREREISAGEAFARSCANPAKRRRVAPRAGIVAGAGTSRLPHGDRRGARVAMASCREPSLPRCQAAAFEAMARRARNSYALACAPVTARAGHRKSDGCRLADCRVQVVGPLSALRTLQRTSAIR